MTEDIEHCCECGYPLFTHAPGCSIAPIPRLRRAPLGFGTAPIADKPIVLRCRTTRPYVLERVLVVGDGVPVTITADGRTLPLDELGAVIFPAAPATEFVLTVRPLGAGRKWWQFWRRKRHVSAGAKGLVSK